MRITAEERRLMDRRMKDRIPPAVLARVTRIPTLVIVVSTTLFISPEAWAKVLDGKARASIVVTETNEGGDVFIRSYAKDELTDKMPENPVVGLNQRLASELTGVINRMGAGLEASDSSKAIHAAKTAQPSKDQFLFEIAALRDAPETRGANVEGLRSVLATEGQRAATATAKSKFDLVSKIGSGFKFNLDLKSMFGKVEAKQEATPRAGTLRYGLIVEDIVPDMKAPKRAAIGNASAEDMQYAGQAEVKWTIGPVEEVKGQPLFTSTGGIYGERTATGAAPSREGGIFDHFKVPSPNFSGTVTPENFENFAKVDKEHLPSWRFDVTQEDGYYSMAYRTALNGDRLSVEHNVKVPVAGTIALGRRFSDNWDVVQTSAYNVLYDKRLPMLSVHYMHINDRIQADMSHKLSTGDAIGVSGRGEAKKADGLKADEIPEAYSVTYTKTF